MLDFGFSFGNQLLLRKYVKGFLIVFKILIWNNGLGLNWQFLIFIGDYIFSYLAF